MGIKPRLDDCSRRPHLLLVSWNDSQQLVVETAMPPSRLDYWHHHSHNRTCEWHSYCFDHTCWRKWLDPVFLPKCCPHQAVDLVSHLNDGYIRFRMVGMDGDHVLRVIEWIPLAPYLDLGLKDPLRRTPYDNYLFARRVELLWKLVLSLHLLVWQFHLRSQHHHNWHKRKLPAF